MKRSAVTAAVLASVCVMLPAEDAYGAEMPETSAKAAVIISADTGEIIGSHNCDEKLPMASTTKIMTALICLESGSLDEQFVVDSSAIKVEGSSMGLCEGDIVTKYDLCCGMLLPSGNDAANAAAVRIAGSLGNFADLMNERAEKLGLSRTYFVTPSGLEGEGHGSSAYDMAILASEALKNDTFREICSSPSMKVCFGDPPYERWLKNTNKLLDMCEGVYGVKTGFTDEAGRCLVSACKRDGKNLICVTLNDKNDWNDHAAMYDYGFTAVEKREPELPDDMEISVVGGVTEKIPLTVNEPVSVTAAAGSQTNFSYEVLSPPFLYAPVKKGEQTAELRISCGGREIRRVPLYAGEECGMAENTVTEKKQHQSFFGGILKKLRRMFS